MQFLRQSTASQEVLLGPFVDSTDGNTEETALTIANTDIKIWKTGATTLANKTSGGATHISNGEYYAVLDATDTDTIGPMIIRVHVAGALAVRLFCTVLDEAVYDVLFGTTAPATATNITAATGVTLAAVTHTGAVIPTVSALTGHTAQTGDSFARLGAPAGASVSADVAAVKSDTASALTRLPAALVGGRMDSSVGAMTSAAVQAIWDAATSALTVVGSIGKLLVDNIDAAISSRSTYAGGAVASVTAAVDITQAAADKVFGASGAALPELAQATPSATPSPRAALMALYMALRNKLDVTATTKSVTNDAGTVIFKKALSDDGTTYSEAEAVSGP